MKILNLGCGSKTSSHPSVVNIDWSILLRIRSNPVLSAFAPLLVKGDRMRRLSELPSNLIVHDLSRGIPFPNKSVDVVYHSHVLEHLDRHVAPRFIRECSRVLGHHGIIRVVVPDFEACCRNYLDHVILCEEGNEEDIIEHDNTIEPILLQSVRREAYGTSKQKPLRRFIENIVLGDARKRGETHQWMYDKHNLAKLLVDNGFRHPKLCSYDSSDIEDWSEIGLDKDEHGNQYKPGSLYMEAIKAESR